MDVQRNHEVPSEEHEPSDNHNSLPAESSSEDNSTSSHTQGTSHEHTRQEVNAVQNSRQTTGSIPVQSSRPGQQENENSQYQNGSNTSLNTQSSVRDEARVAVVIYDMLMRAGPQAGTLSAQLAQAYPVAAALARYYAIHASHLMPFFVQHPPNCSQRRGSLVLRRVSVSSVARFSSFIGSILALLRIWVIFSLALGATIASSCESALMSQVVENIVSLFIERGPKRELYRWMFTILNERTPLVALGTNGATAGSIHALLPTKAAAALLITPITSGILGFAIGVLAALCINSALRVAGGIRLESQED